MLHLKFKLVGIILATPFIIDSFRLVQLRIAGGKTVANVSNELYAWSPSPDAILRRALTPSLVDPERDPWSCATRPMSDWLDTFCAFLGSSCPHYMVRQTGHAIYTAYIAISEGSTRKRCSGQICVGEVLRWVYCKCSYAAINTSKIGRLSNALSPFLMGQVGGVFILFLPQHPRQLFTTGDPRLRRDYNTVELDDG